MSDFYCCDYHESLKKDRVIEKTKELIQAAYELRHVKFGREYKKACEKFDKLYAELENEWD